MTAMEPVVYQSVCNILSFEMRAKRIYLNPPYHIGLDWIAYFTRWNTHRLTKSADVAGAVDCSLQRSGNRVGVGDNSDVCGLIVDLGASAHRPRRIQLLVDAACFDTERRVAALRVRVVELNQVETTTRMEHVLAQYKLRPGPNLASTSTIQV